MLDRSEQSLPSRLIIGRKLEDLLADRLTREQAADWARPYALGEVSEYADPSDLPAWNALTSIAMCDGKHSDGRYMYDKTSFHTWLEQLKASPSEGA